ncbi:hypothetical protein VNI00_005514 [Paramarasmius palmivorus]|uniref:Uncharacterized protein n=1 Tax=Paramarasmius palmivorus TaxID=297713 RepID=A0AAW0DB63_9AGAR
MILYQVLKLDINQDPYDVLDAIRDGQQSIQLPGGTVVDLVRCDTLAKPKFKSYHHMFDCENPDANSRCPEVVNEATGFFVVEPGRSIVFYSGGELTQMASSSLAQHETLEPAKVTPSSLELVIIRRTAMGSGSDTSNQDQPRTKWFCPNPSDGDLLYQWIRSVVELTHEGEMTQFGLTNGSRHTRHHKSEKGRQIPADATITSFGWGVSYRKKLLEEDCRAHDADVNGAGGIVWSLIAATMPQSVIQEVTSKLSLHKVPHLVSRYIAPGKGYRIKLNEREYVFPDADRAPPPQLFMTWGYSAWSHTDPCYATWAFNLNVGREQYETATSDSIDVPAYGGANFVDVSLQVVVVNSAGTLMAFKPSHHHGTTVSGGTTNYYITFAFSKDISDALDNPGDRSYLGDCSWET